MTSPSVASVAERVNAMVRSSSTMTRESEPMVNPARAPPATVRVSGPSKALSSWAPPVLRVKEPVPLLW